MSKLNCHMVISFIEMFFTSNLNPNVKNLVLSHLITCPKCLDIYKEYSKNKGYGEFNVLDDVFSIAKDFDTSSDLQDEINKKLESYQASATVKDLNIAPKDKWTQIAKDYDITKLLGLQSFRDLILEYDCDTDTGNTDYVPYYKYIITKIAQKVDHLENCLIKSNK